MAYTFNLFEHIFSKKKLIKHELTLFSAIRNLRSDKYEAQIQKLRSTTDKSVYNVLKKELPGFTFSGTFKGERKAENLLVHTGLICMDFDLNGLHPHPDFPKDSTKKILADEFNVENVRYRLSIDPYTLILFTSPGGSGLKCIVRIDPNNHLNSFHALEKYYLEKYGLVADTSGKDVSRLCFVSHDPYLFFNGSYDGKTFVPEALEFSAGASKPAPAVVPAVQRDYDIDEETGEVIERPEPSWNVDLRNSYDRAVQTVRRIVEAKKDITGIYQDWLEIGLSLALFGEKGRELFHKVSQFHDQYNEKSCNHKFDDCLKNGRFKTPAKFFAVAKEYDIDTRRSREIPSGTAEGAEGREYRDYEVMWPKDIEGTKEYRDQIFKYGFFQHGNRFFHGIYDMKNRRISFDETSNYIIHPLFLIMSRAEPKRIIEIENIYGVRKLVEIPAQAFVSLNEFNAFIEGQGNFLNELDKKQFHKVKKKIYDETKEAAEIRTLGYHNKGFYAFSNGVFTNEFVPADDYGIVEINKSYFFLPALSSIYREEEEDFQTHKKFIYRKSKIKYIEWAAQFCKMHKDNGKIGLMYYISALFRDVVFELFKFFPHLFLFGPPGTGKSQLGVSITSMFGNPLQPFLLTSGTPVAFHKRFAEFRNAVIWFDEYRNTIEPRRIQALKGAFDGSAHEKSENTSANRTRSTPVNSGCVISGQELPIADNALFKRVILLQYYQTEFSQQERDERSKLLEMEKTGLSYLTAHLTTLRPLVEQNFLSVYENTMKEFKQLLDNTDGIEERIIQNMCVLVAMQRVLSNALEFPFTVDEFKAIALSNIKAQNTLILSSKETHAFWQMVEFMLDKKDIHEGEDFVVKTVSRLEVMEGDGKKTIDLYPSKELLFLKLSKIHPLYMKYHREQFNALGMDLNSIRHYLKNQKPFIGHVSQVRFRNSKTSAMVFDYDLLKKSGVNLDRGDNIDKENRTEGFTEEVKVEVQGELPLNPPSTPLNNDTDAIPF